jgi:glutamate/tyrosine decarboxylase-like PLP-dependent enzyme
MTSQPRTKVIVAVSCAEVNTGRFATDYRDMKAIRELCDAHGGWMHVDAAFGLLARVLPEIAEYRTVRDGVAGLELADSITGDAHKLLNVVSGTLYLPSKSAR